MINACRGPVVDNRALDARLERKTAPTCVLDVWEEEPWVPPTLCASVWLGSPHVAGYSAEGKLRGSWTLHRALADFLHQDVPAPTLPEQGTRNWDVQDWPDVLALLRRHYRIEDDHRRLLESLSAPDPARAFDQLRKNYPLRHELAAWQWRGEGAARWRDMRVLLTDA